MISEKITVKNKSGLHARPATNFSKLARQFASAVTVKKAGASFNGKSVINVLSAGIVCGTEIELVTEGPDEQEAMNALLEAIRSGLGENE